MRLALLLLAVLALPGSLTLIGCDSNHPTSEVCDALNCECPATSSCARACGGGCGMRCEDRATCTFANGDSSNIGCHDNSSCTGLAGEHTRLQCNGDATCDLTLGASSQASCEVSADCTLALAEQGVATCEGNAHCTLTLAPTARAECHGASRCTVEAPDGGGEVSCDDTSQCEVHGAGVRVTCGGLARCLLTCAGSDCQLGCTPAAVTCPGGVLACREGC